MTSTLPMQLPSDSNASFSRGMWYVFTDGPNIIRAWGSTWLSVERIYFNDQLVDHHNQKHQEQYSFTANTCEYRIRCITHFQQHWQAECQLWRNNQKIGGLRCKRKKILNIRPTLAHLFIGLAAGIVGGLLNPPFWYGIFFIFVTMILTLLTTMKTDRFVFEHSTQDAQGNLT